MLAAMSALDGISLGTSTRNNLAQVPIYYEDLSGNILALDY